MLKVLSGVTVIFIEVAIDGRRSKCSSLSEVAE